MRDGEPDAQGKVAGFGELKSRRMIAVRSDLVARLERLPGATWNERIEAVLKEAGR